MSSSSYDWVARDREMKALLKKMHDAETINLLRFKESYTASKSEGTREENVERTKALLKEKKENDAEAQATFFEGFMAIQTKKTQDNVKKDEKTTIHLSKTPSIK